MDKVRDPPATIPAALADVAKRSEPGVGMTIGGEKSGRKGVIEVPYVQFGVMQPALNEYPPITHRHVLPAGTETGVSPET
jgi:hypothetical protein